MAEFCLDCFNKLNDTNYTKWDVKLSWGLDLCEECCEFKHVVVVIRDHRSFVHWFFRH